MPIQDIELMADTLIELGLPHEELRMFTLRLPMDISQRFVPVMRNRHRVEIFG